MREQTAQRILAVRPDTSNRAPHRTVDGLGTRRRLQALVALGWPQSWLADMLHRDPSNLRRALHSDRVTARTAEDVAALYHRLWDTRPPRDTPRHRRAVADAIALAARHGWITPLAWDDPDHDTEPPDASSAGDDDIDEIAVERAMTASGVRFRDLRPDEQAEAVRRLTADGRSIHTIAECLATSTRTVSRRRRGSAA
jgi:predicted component of type VI protein secretion system